jgi:hypothetical protein
VSTCRPNIPAKDIWSFTLYDNQTRSMLQTDQKSPAVGSLSEGLHVNADGSVDVYFGPNAPPGKEANWVQTIPGKAWNTLLRLYGLLKPWFNKTWRPGGIGAALISRELQRLRLDSLNRHRIIVRKTGPCSPDVRPCCFGGAP